MKYLITIEVENEMNAPSEETINLLNEKTNEFCCALSRQIATIKIKHTVKPKEFVDVMKKISYL